MKLVLSSLSVERKTPKQDTFRHFKKVFCCNIISVKPSFKAAFHNTNINCKIILTAF